MGGKQKPPREALGGGVQKIEGQSAGQLPVHGVLVVLQVRAVGQGDRAAFLDGGIQLDLDIAFHGRILLQVRLGQRAVNGQTVGSGILLCVVTQCFYNFF